MNAKVLVPLLALFLVGAGVVFLASRGEKTGSDSLSVGGNNLETETGSAGKSGAEQFAGIQTLGVPVLELNSSGQMGGVGFVEEGDGKTRATLEVTPLGGNQTASIRLGSCPTPGEVAFQLGAVSNGKAEAVLETSLKDMLVELPMAVVVQASANSNNYTACGDILLPSSE